MEMYTGAEPRATETYMIRGTGSNPHPIFQPQLEEIGYMGNEMAPEFIVDQGVYYPAANYYGYYPTGYESPGEWDDHNRFLGLDGQDVHYSGLQTESLPYAYYTPSYGYAQSPYNPYNPYIPGAVIGLDGTYVGTQQYYTNPPYQQPAYIPVVVQPGTDAVPNSSLDPSLFGTSASMSSAHVNPGVKYTAPLPSNFVAANSQRSASGNLTSETSQSFHTTAKTSEGSLVNLPPSKQSSLQGAMPLGSAAHVPQNPLKVTIPSNDGISHFGSNVRGWAPVDKFRPRLQINGVVNNPTGGTDVLCEQNRGPRTSRSKGQWTSAIVDGGYASKVSASNAQRSILINADQYNKDDFPVTYPNAKFFVIKSYSEDDVHKSIKYNVWSSTPNGNKKLGSAYEDAQRISVGKQRNCPIFLFFSVNASGQFCGVSEMIGPVDFHKDMNFWQQDKWTGSFPVKWHIIKDVPNTSFRHIILENNENKPVTNSRDTQEILYLPGMNMLNIFKNSPLKTSILDDFMFYEERERIMQEEKFRLLGRSYDSSQFLPAIVPVNRTDVTVVQPSKADEEQSSPELNDPPKADEKLVCGASHQPPKADGKKSDGLIDQPTKTNGKRANGTVDQPPKAPANGVVDQAPKGDGKLVCGASHQPPKADGKNDDGLVGQPTKSDGKQANCTVDQSPKADGKPPNGAVDQPPKGDGKSSNGGTVDQAPMSGGKPVNGIVDEPLKADTIATKPNDPKKTGDHPPMTGRSPSKPKEPRSTADRPLKADRKDPTSTSDQHPRADKNPGKPRDLKNTGKARTSDEQAARKLNSIKPAEDKNNTKPNLTGDTSAVNSVAIDPKEGESTDVVTVGSMRIRVNGRGESSSSSIITVGATIPTEPPKGLKHKKQVALAVSRPPQK